MNWVSIGSGNGLLPIRCQAITWTSADLLSIEPLWTNFSEIWIKIQNFSFIKMELKMSFAKWRPCCPTGDELTQSCLNKMVRHLQARYLTEFVWNKFVALWLKFHWSLTYWPCNIWHHRFMSTLVQVMAGCHQRPSHYLNECWLISLKALAFTWLQFHGKCSVYLSFKNKNITRRAMHITVSGPYTTQWLIIHNFDLTMMMIRS